VYHAPLPGQEESACLGIPDGAPESELPEQALGFRVQLYGYRRHRDLFTARQLAALVTLCDLVREAREQIRGTSSDAYSDAVATYLGLLVSRVADYQSALCTWASNPQMEIVRGTFARQALSMIWDFAEGNIFGPSTGSVDILLESIARVVDRLGDGHSGVVSQSDATAADNLLTGYVASTDPPYYDNIGYADLSDFFYIWLRLALGSIHPALFATLLTPKAPELIATPHRHEGSQEKACSFFEQGLGRAFSLIRGRHNLGYPLTVYYAFKQAETEEDDDATSDEGSSAIASTGWETMLEGLVRADFSITGTWPMRTERSGRSRNIGSNALASSIILVCRPRPADAPLATRKQFITALRQELPEALRNLQRGNIAPVDLAQAAIGPGMAVFTRYAKVVESDGSPMRVRTALQLINQALDEVLAEQEGEFDADTRWALAWFEQHGMDEGPFGVAEILSKAKDTAVQGLVQAGVVKARGGKVQLLRRDELPDDWDPATDQRLTVWEVTQHLIRTLDRQGESGAAALMQKLGGKAEVARDLAYRLYTVCERKKWAEEALAYNGLVIAWPELTRLAQASPAGTEPKQQTFAD
jgi:putative DNA methylase